jgi:hypothetical protein
MKKSTSRITIVALSIAISIAMVCSALPALEAGAQVVPQYGDYGGGYGGAYRYGGNVPATYPAEGDSGDFESLQGMEGFQGFHPGRNVLSIAIIPVSQKDSQMGFQVIGFAISSPEGGQATVYSLSKALAGVIDPAQNTLQIDLSGIETAIDKAGYVDSSIVYDTIRTEPKVVVIEVDMDYQGKQDSQTTFSVNGVDIVPPDGRMQAFEMEEPTQLIIDSQTMRLYMVAFPQMINTFGSTYGATYTQVQPVAYAEPVPVFAPVAVPYLRPYPIFFSSFVPYRPFVYGAGFTTFYDRANIRYPIRSRDFGRHEYNQFRRTNINIGQVGPDIGRPGIGRPGIGTPGIGTPGIGTPGIGTPSIKRPGAVGGGFGGKRSAGIGGGRAGGGRGRR